MASFFKALFREKVRKKIACLKAELALGYGSQFFEFIFYC